MRFTSRYSAVLVCGALLSVGLAQQTAPIYRMDGGHVAQVYSVAFSPDGAFLLSAGGDGTVKFWRVSDRLLTRTWSVRTGSTAAAAYRVAFSPDGALVAIAASDGYVWVRRVADGAVVRVWYVPTTPVVAFAPNGLLAISESTHISLWRVAEGQLVRRIPIPQDAGAVTTLAFSPDSLLLASGHENYRTFVWRVGNGALLVQLSAGGARVAFAADGQHLLVAAPSAVGLLRLGDNQFLYVRSYPGWIGAIAVAPNNSLFALASNNQVLLCRLSDGELLQAIPRSGQPSVESLAFSPNSQFLAFGDSSGGLNLVEVANLAVVSPLTTHRYSVVQLLFSADGHWLLSKGSQEGFWVWRGAARVRELPRGSNATLANREGIPIVAYNENGVIRLLRLDTNALLASLPTTMASQPTLSPNGLWMAEQLAHNQYRLWRTSDWTLLHDRTEPNATVFLFTPDSSAVIIGSSSGARLLSVPDLNLLGFVPPAPNQVIRLSAFSPDGRYLAGISSAGIEIFDMVRARHLHTLPMPSIIAFAQFSPDSKYVMAGNYGFEPRVRVWRLRDANLMLEIRDEVVEGVFSGAFRPDGRFLVYGRGDGTIVYRFNPFHVRGDVNGDGIVDDGDLLRVLNAFGTTDSELPEDINLDGTVNDTDLLEVLFAFGSGERD